MSSDSVPVESVCASDRPGRAPLGERLAALDAALQALGIDPDGDDAGEDDLGCDALEVDSLGGGMPAGNFRRPAGGSGVGGMASGGVVASAARSARLAWSRQQPARSGSARRLPSRFRDEAAEWVYEVAARWRLDRSDRVRVAASGELAHDAHVVELGRLWRFPEVAGSVVVPRGLERLPELAWVAQVAEAGVWRRGGRRRLVWFVPSWQWEVRCRSRVDVSSAQFDVRRVVDLERFAELTGLSASTLRVYRRRGLLPPPVAQVGVSPVWTRDQVAAWLLGEVVP